MRLKQTLPFVSHRVPSFTWLLEASTTRRNYFSAPSATDFIRTNPHSLALDPAHAHPKAHFRLPSLQASTYQRQPLQLFSQLQLQLLNRSNGCLLYRRRRGPRCVRLRPRYVNASQSRTALIWHTDTPSAPGSCPAGVQVCGTTCCAGPATAFNCENGACVPVAPPEGVTSPSIPLVTTAPTVVPEPANTTVSVPLVSGSVTTVNVTSFSTTAFPTGNHTETHSHSASGTETGEPPKPSGAAGMLFPGTGALGVAVAAALGAL